LDVGLYEFNFVFSAGEATQQRIVEKFVIGSNQPEADNPSDELPMSDDIFSV